MNALRTLVSRRARCLTLCAAWLSAVSGHADEVAAQALSTRSLSIDGVHGKSTRSAKGTGGWSASASAMPAAWMSSDLVPSQWRQDDPVVVHRAADWFADGQEFTGVSGFDTSNLFRTRKEQKARDMLRLLLSKRQVRVWLREDLHLQAEVKRYRAMDDSRELGLKLGLYYKFE